MEEIWPTHARRPDFEFDFEFFLFWFDDFRRVVEWETGFLLFRFNGRRLVFSFSFSGLISGDISVMFFFSFFLFFFF
jgi:hypothetical protein